MIPQNKLEVIIREETASLQGEELQRELLVQQSVQNYLLKQTHDLQRKHLRFYTYVLIFALIFFLAESTMTVMRIMALRH